LYCEGGERFLPFARFASFVVNMPAPSVAIVDIGSNSIKVLVAASAPAGGVAVLATKTVDARIGGGIGRAHPHLTEDSMDRGLAAVRRLLAVAAPFAPVRTILVATSAVRDAANGAEFRERVRAATGQSIRILTGEEEANLIGRGLTCDPALANLRDFYLFDLGGGSLECLAFRDRRIRQSTSLPLGCVRLTEQFAADSASPFGPEAAAAVAGHVRATLAPDRFAFDLPADAGAIGTGGTMTTIRAILAARTGRAFDAIEPLVAADQLRALLGELGPLTLAERRRIPGLPSARADVFPAGVATFLAVAEIGGVRAFRHSFYNLRFGLAAETLAQI
jgi:exopolyphosphatase/guanosine-5'-triphosphate,3'-diphosphate pyrophosphatase